MTQKWNLQDIRPVQQKKSAKIQRRSGSSQKSHSRNIDTQNTTEPDNIAHVPIIDGNKKKKRTLLYALIIFFIIVGGGILASILTGGAEITVHPRYREPNVNATFVATKSPQPKELAFEIMTLEAEGERQVSATGKEEVKTQAQGTILIYNNYQTKPVRLVTNTRFETGGLIYRIKDSAVVPGFTKDADGKKVPGVITAEVFADDVGEEYNVPPSRFTIPGFKGEPEYQDIYAESIETFAGGFNGNKFIIDEAELQTAKQALQMELRNSLLKRIASEKPAGLVLFNDSVTFTYQSLPSVAYGDNLATIKEKVTMRIPLFKADNFASFIADATVPGYEGDKVRITDYDVFNFTYTTATTSSSDLSLSDKISFKLTGRPQIVWEYDAEKLKTDLLNKNKTALPSVLGAYPAIEKAEAVIRPFWKTKFPINITEIEIVEVIE